MHECSITFCILSKFSVYKLSFPLIDGSVVWLLHLGWFLLWSRLVREIWSVWQKALSLPYHLTITGVKMTHIWWDHKWYLLVIKSVHDIWVFTNPSRGLRSKAIAAELLLVSLVYRKNRSTGQRATPSIHDLFTSINILSWSHVQLDLLPPPVPHVHYNIGMCIEGTVYVWHHVNTPQPLHNQKANHLCSRISTNMIIILVRSSCIAKGMLRPIFYQCRKCIRSVIVLLSVSANSNSIIYPRGIQSTPKHRRK